MHRLDITMLMASCATHAGAEEQAGPTVDKAADKAKSSGKQAASKAKDAAGQARDGAHKTIKGDWQGLCMPSCITLLPV